MFPWLAKKPQKTKKQTQNVKVSDSEKVVNQSDKEPVKQVRGRPAKTGK